MSDKYQWTATGMSVTAVENGPMRYVREVDYDALQAEVNRYRDAIKKWLDGDYPNPRRNRPDWCMHGVNYWQSCENCETEYWQSVIEQTEKDQEDTIGGELCEHCHEYTVDPDLKWMQEPGRMCPLCIEYTIPTTGEDDE